MFYSFTVLFLRHILAVNANNNNLELTFQWHESLILIFEYRRKYLEPL